MFSGVQPHPMEWGFIYILKNIQFIHFITIALLFGFILSQTSRGWQSNNIHVRHALIPAPISTGSVL
jgi:hypothetical protein